jgi:2',3'-cyclic-nucleotide 2'-phosphodiesterase (5'-nucleotidase family)
MESAEKVGQTWIVQSGQYARNVGVALAPVEDDGDWNWERIDLREDGFPPLPELSAHVDLWNQRVDERFGVSIGMVEGNLKRDQPGQSPMGSWASDVVRLASDADVGIYNRGGLREDLVEGELSLLDLYHVFPFGNSVVSFSWTGAQLQAVVERNLQGEISEDPAPIQWSGLRYHWVLEEGEPRLMELWVGDEKVELDVVYSIGTNVFVAWQWEKILGEAPGGELQDHGLTVFQAAEQVARLGPIRVPVEARSIRLSSP